MSNAKKILVVSLVVTFLFVIIVTGILIIAIPKNKNTSSTDGIKTTLPTTVTTTSTTGIIDSIMLMTVQKFWLYLLWLFTGRYIIQVRPERFSTKAPKSVVDLFI